MNEQALRVRLQTLAKERNIHFNHCWKLLILERFLARLSRSSLHDRLIFKGGFLLSYLMEIGRETTDLDFLLNRMKGGEKELEVAFDEIISLPDLDGFSFSFLELKPLLQPHMQY